MKRRLVFGLVALALGVNLVVGARIYLAAAQRAEKDSPYPSLEIFALVLEKVRRDHVEGDKFTYDELVRKALKGMVQALDPHSEYLDASEYKDLQQDTQGSFGGLGIVVSIRDNFLTVVAPMEDTPGFRAGILAGDRILEIDGKSTEKMSLQEAVRNLRGQPGTEVTIKIQRPSTGMIKEMRLTRAVINIDLVKDINGKREFPLGEDKIGYIRIVQFAERTGAELEAAIKKLKAQGMQALILDLRWNPGGLLDQAVDVCSKFLPRGKPVVSTEGRTPEQNTVRKARGGDLLTNRDGTPMPMVVLVNLGSASASEIVAGCLQDLRRAIILGEKTFGKGSVQSILPLPDGSALKLTTALYYTPSKKVIHAEGITPDIIVPMTEEDERNVMLQRTPGGIEALDEKERERVLATRDVQLDRATDLLRGILLYTQRQQKLGRQTTAKYAAPAESIHASAR
ncbi:MAG: S41 family peptidase [Verrucomicrobiae bacterium]|nr:S41 family peptidase [Verrucomicrobiae bacterium]